MNIIKVLASFGVVSLSACTNYMPVESEPVPVGFIQSFDTERVTSTNPTTIRTFIRDADDNRVEVQASCTFTAQEFRAEVMTPSVVLLPTIKSPPSNLLVRCEGAERIGQLTLEPSLPDAQVITGAGLGAALVTGLISAAASSAADNWTYADSGLINMDLR